MSAHRKHHRASPLIATASLLALLCVGGGTGCSIGGVVGGVVGATALGAYVPAHEIQQVYYLGSFDRLGQLPAEFYRITVRGQASVISNMRFGSGWAPAALVDSLGGRVGLPPEEGETAQGQGTEVHIKTGRAMVQFGPEGFREAPRDHRLVIVMGGDPSAFFEAIDTSLGTIARVQRVQQNSVVSQSLFREYVRLSEERIGLLALEQDLENSLVAPAEAN